MKKGKRLTRAQKIRLTEVRLVVNNWFALSPESDGFKIVHKISGNVRKVLLRIEK